MSIALVKNQSLYKLYKELPYTFNSATLHLIDCLIKQSGENKTVINMYINLDEQWLQYISNNNLYPIASKEAIWEHDLKIGTFDWKYATFYIGQTASIELKDNTQALTSMLDLNNSSNQATIDIVDSKSILTQYEIATRLSITDFNYNIDETMATELVSHLGNVYQTRISNRLLDLYVVIIKQNKSYQLIGTKLVEIHKSNDLVPIKSTECIIFDTIKTELVHDNKTYMIECEITNTTSPYVCLSNKTRVIGKIEYPSSYSHFYKDFDLYGINIKILNLKLNLFRTDFNWQLLPYDVLMNHVYGKISQCLVKSKVQIRQTEAVTEQFNVTQLEDIKTLLTKAFDDSVSTNRFDDFEIKKDKLKFSYHADDDKKITINLIKTKQKEFKHEWLQLQLVKEEAIEQVYEYDVTFNVDHPFFKEFLADKEYASKIEQFVICFAIAETICRLDGGNVTQLKYEINKLLRGA